MVTTRSNPLIGPKKPPHFIYITGCDGTGKTTQAQLLMEQLKTQGIWVQHVWLRFPFFLSIPLVAYARLSGYSWHEEVDGFRHGYWDFSRSWVMRKIFPWVLLVDAALAGLLKVYLPLFIGKTIVCERFVLDTLVDLAVALRDKDFFYRIPGRFFIRLIPCGSIIFVMDLDAKSIRDRRKDLQTDRQLEARLEAFHQLSSGLKMKVVCNQNPVSIINKQLWLEIKE